MSKYSDGYRFECMTRDDLREQGYEVMRSAGSKGKIDVLGMKPGQLLFVQCKINGKCSPAERAEVFRLSRMVGAVPLVAYKHKDGRSAAVVKYRMLTGSGPSAWVVWSPDELGNDARGITV